MKTTASIARWKKAIRQYRRLKQQPFEQRSQIQKARVCDRLRLLQKRIQRMHRQWGISIPAAALLAWLANPVLGQDTIQYQSDPRVKMIDQEVFGNPLTAWSPQTLDFDGDGEQDLLLSEGNGQHSLLFFGTGDSNLLTVDNPALLNGANGFVLHDSNKPVVLDINHDGKDDIVTKAGSWGNPYVLFGSDSLMPDTIYANNIDSTDGFHLIAPNAYVFADNMVALEDFNGDGIEDLALFDYYRQYNGTHPSYILFGSQSGFDFVTNLQNLAPGDGLELIATGNYWAAGTAAGDFNGDGATDVAVGLYDTKKVEILFGNPNGFSGNSINWNTAVASGSTGFSIQGTLVSNGFFGVDVSAPGDLNNDGFDDLLVAAEVDVFGANDGVSAVYGLYGASSFPGTIPVGNLMGNTGFKVSVDASYPRLSSAGDLNSDGLPDFMISPDLYTVIGSITDANSYVVYGACSYPSNSGVSALVQSHGGIVIPGTKFHGTDAVGDFNQDGFADAPFLSIQDSAAYLLTSVAGPQLEAGGSDCGCESAPFLLAGTAGVGWTNVHWSSTGTGTFADSSMLNTTYTPSTADANMGQVWLVLEADNAANTCLSQQDSLVLFLQPALTVDAGLDETICESDDAVLSGSGSGAQSAFVWSTSGTGNFADANDPNTTYMPSTADGTMGGVTLTLTHSDPHGACPSTSDDKQLTLDPAAGVDAGPDTAVCHTCTFMANGLLSGSATSASWMSSGTGTFDDVNLLNATYTPSSQDVASGWVILTLTSDDPVGPCAAVVDDMVLSIERTSSAGRIQPEESFRIFPNPASPDQEISFGKLLHHVKIYSPQGALVAEYPLASSILIPQPGIYLLVADEGVSKIIVH